MSSKYKIGETVRIKATGEKKRIDLIDDFGMPYRTEDGCRYGEHQLKTYQPSRTGKYRDEYGRFTRSTIPISDLFWKMERNSKQQSDKKIEKVNQNYFIEGLAERLLADKINEIIDRLNTL